MDRLQAAAMARNQFAHLRRHRPAGEPHIEEPEPEPEPEPDLKVEERIVYPAGPEGMMMKAEAVKARRTAIEAAAIAQAEAYKKESGTRLTAGEQRANEVNANRLQRERQKKKDAEQRARAVARNKVRLNETDAQRKKRIA